MSGPGTRALLALALAVALAVPAGAGVRRTATGADGPIPPLAGDGRWLVDAAGRVVMLHGFNHVAKSAPFYPAAFGFGDDDAAFLAAEGFNGFRLGVVLEGLLPAPGQVDESYIDRLAETVDALAAHRLFVLLDFHQDGFAPLFNGNGFPDWMAIGDGLPNPPDAVFPFYYVQNPAMQRAFEHFWANSPGPDAIGLQDSFVQGLARIVERFAANPWVLGYEPINEPWPGAVWQPCLLDPGGCPDLEQQLLVPFYQRVNAAVRATTATQLVFAEPFVLFNFGEVPTTLPGAGSGNALSFHSYAVDVAGEEAVVAQAVAAAERDRAPVLATEFGATLDPVILNRIAGQMEGARVPWLEWAYNESIIARPAEPAGADNLRSTEAFAALVRPYPAALTGTPTQIAFDPASRSFALDYDTRSPGGERYRRRLVSVVSLPARQYPDGFAVTVSGASVTSRPCVSPLTLRNRPHTARVSVRVTPAVAGSRRARQCQRAARN